MGYNALFIAGSGIAFVVALLGLSYGSSGVRATRLWPPAAIGTAAGITIVGGGVAIQLNGWDKAWTMGFPIFLLVLGLTAAYASSLMFTVNLLREGKAGRTAARLLRVGSALGVATMASFTLAWASGSLASIPAPVIEVSSVVAMILFAVGWIAVGVSVLLRDIAAAHELSARNQPA
jgi:hypothetical protein